MLAEYKSIMKSTLDAIDLENHRNMLNKNQIQSRIHEDTTTLTLIKLLVSIKQYSQTFVLQG